jgi:hypothetical protein
MFKPEQICPICRSPASVEPSAKGDSYDVACPACGRFEIERRAQVNYANGLDDEPRRAVQNYVREHQGDKRPKLTTAVIASLLAGKHRQAS